MEARAGTSGASERQPPGPRAAATAGSGVCSLCGLPVPLSAIHYGTDAEELRFCCHGCRQVYLLLAAASGVLPEGFRETELYRVCAEAGIIPALSSAANARTVPEAANVAALELSCAVEGMWCPSCAWLIEQLLTRMHGVLRSKVSFVSDRLRISYLPHLISPAEIVSRLGQLGYRLIVDTGQATGWEGRKRDALSLGVAAIFTANIMMVSAVFYGFFDVPAGIAAGLGYPVLAMTAFVLFYAGLPILKRGVVSLRYGSPSMDTLIALGALSAFGYSIAELLTGGLHLYFDTASMLVTFVLLGRYVEGRARQNIRSATDDLSRVGRTKVRLADGKQTWTRADLILRGELFTVSTGETIPLDGRVAAGAAIIDESIVTGEPVPKNKGPGDTVPGGSSVLDGDVTLEATAASADSLAGRMAAAIENGLETKDDYERLADRISRAFVPAVFSIAAATGIVVWFLGLPMNQALLRALTVLLIACPCSLGLATPLVKVAAVGCARRLGILVGNPSALERLHTIDTVIFDKTGTLTEGSFTLEEIIHKATDDSVVLSRLAGVEMHARHFIGKEIVREAEKRSIPVGPAERFEEYAGCGIRGAANDGDTYIGNRAFMSMHGMEIDEDLCRQVEVHESNGKTCVFFAWDGKAQGLLVFGDRMRAGAREAVERLQGRGIDVWLVSGDGGATTQAAAQSVGIGRFKGGVLPDGKVELIQSLRANGRRVAMIGDGINDAPALANADVGCAFAARTDIAADAADIAFLTPDFGKLFQALSLSSIAMRTIRQNLFFAFLYNGVAIVLAALGLLNPFIAVIAMAGSSLTVTANAFRLGRGRISA